MKSRLPDGFKEVILQITLLVLLFGVLIAFYKGGTHLARIEPHDMHIEDLPGALFLSLLRMTVSYFISLFVAFSLGLAAARTRGGERFILPVLDILQSVPVVGFFPVAISIFISASGGARWGIELAAVFLILTSQAWNLAFAVYESVKALPRDIDEAASSLGLPASLKFFRVYAPACIPRLIPNSILSWSNGWFFLVACEIIAVGSLRYHLPGIGSYLASAAERDQLHLVFQGILALTGLILLLDFLVWRPLTRWARRFLYIAEADEPESTEMIPGTSQMINEWTQWTKPWRKPATKLSRAALYVPSELAKRALVPYLWDAPHAAFRKLQRKWDRADTKEKGPYEAVGWALLLVVSSWAGYHFADWFQSPWPAFAPEIPKAMLYSTLRLVTALGLSLAWVLPLIYFTWNRPKIRQTLSTLAQVGASIPATALFPLIILIAVRKFGGGMEAATLVLLLMGMQWYVLFNALGGAEVIPPDLSEVTRSLGLGRRLTWKKLILPSIRPALITGLITAWGGGWNALVVSEYVVYKERVMSVRGIGALINRSVYQLADPSGTLLCLFVMVAWIVLLNFLVWQPLYRRAIESSQAAA